ncbi:F-box/RNI-like superfamily protein [Striga asiatica]|uniref:F-box/RNI-like superfamily protein n=1 Tax=Striga asiatica TaxID=4170 RepID=A0A5A7QMI6_STRAF|nr:F-box/RNI-like superfamily protein [Striga asiatica]
MVSGGGGGGHEDGEALALALESGDPPASTEAEAGGDGRAVEVVDLALVVFRNNVILKIQLRLVLTTLTIGHILNYTARREPPAARISGPAIGSFSYGVNRHINHGPQALRVLLAKPEEIDLSYGNQW